MSKPIESQETYLDVIEQIDVHYAEMRSARPLSNAGVKYFINEFAISITHSGNAIEGNTFTFDETKLLLEKGIAIGTHTFRENQDIVGYKKGFDFLYSSLKSNREIDEDFIKKIHFYVLLGDEEAGNYRTVQNYVGNLARIVYTPCSAQEVPQNMQNYVAKVKDDLFGMILEMNNDKIDWTAVFRTLAEHHIQFENIHPFIDGNGRMSRILTTLLLYKSGYVVGKYISLEKKIHANKNEYYDALQQSSENWHENKNDDTAFTKYLLGVILSAYRDFEERIDLVSVKKSALQTVQDAFKLKSEKLRKVILWNYALRLTVLPLKRL